MGHLDRGGLEGMPLKLMMTALIIALSIHPLYGSISYLQYSQGLGRAVNEAEEIKQAATSAYLGGPGNVRTVSIVLNEGSGSFSLRLGGPQGGGGSRTIDVLYRDDLAATVALDGEGLSIVSADGESLRIEGKAHLTLTCCQLNDGTGILAAMAP